MQKKKPKVSNASPGPLPAVTADERYRMIAEAAYYRALHRGFHGGSAEDDWFQAEQQINKELLDASPRPARRPSRPAPKRMVVMAEQTRH